MKKEIRDDYKKILSFVKRAEKSEPIDLQEMLRTNMHLFLEIQNTFETGSEEDKKEVMGMLNDVFSLFMKESKHITERMGLSESEILSVGENPNLFTSEQWKMIQEAKDQINQTGMNLSNLLYKKKSTDSSK